MIRILQSTWLAAVVAVLSYASTTGLLLRSGIRAAREQVRPKPIGKQEPAIGPSWTFKNPEVDQLVAELREGKEALKAKEQELNDLQHRLAAEWQELGAITQKVAAAQAEMDRALVQIKEDELVNLKRLAKVYSAMSPEGAAKILVEMQDDQLVRLLGLMKEAETAPVLENIAKEGRASARRVALISDRLRLVTTRRMPDKPKAQ